MIDVEMMRRIGVNEFSCNVCSFIFSHINQEIFTKHWAKAQTWHLYRSVQFLQLCLKYWFSRLDACWIWFLASGQWQLLWAVGNDAYLDVFSIHGKTVLWERVLMATWNTLVVQISPWARFCSLCCVSLEFRLH